MPVTDLSGDDDWLQQFLAGHQAGQAFGASQPYGPQGAPGPYSGGPQAWMPGGALMGRQQTTPGAPSMGYPALGQPGAQQPPTAAPGPAQGLSLTSNPLLAIGPPGKPGAWMTVGWPNLANISPEAAHDLAVTKQKLGGVLNAAAQGQPTNSADLVGAGDTSLGSILPQARGVAVPGSPAAPTTADPTARGGSGYGGVPPSGWGSSPASASTRPLPARPVTPTPRTAYVGQQPGSGAPAGSPSQTPATPQGAQSARFGLVQVDRPNMPAAGGPRGGPPQMTALNLAGLFGGGQQAANPANVPAPNAQPVSGALGPSGMSNAPWWMGPFQPNAFGPPTPDQIAGRGLKQRYG